MSNQLKLAKTWDTYSEVNSRKAVAPEDFPFFDELGLKKRHYVLDIGCGAGQDLSLIAQFADNTFGVDISRGMLVRASQQHLAVCMSDCRRLPFPDNAFDVAYSLIVINYVKDWEAAIAELARVLKPGGLGLVVGANTWSILTPLRKLFHFLNLYRYGATYHTSPSSLSRAGKNNGMAVKALRVNSKLIPMDKSLQSKLYSALTGIDLMLHRVFPRWGNDVAILFQKN